MIPHAAIVEQDGQLWLAIEWPNGIATSIPREANALGLRWAFLRLAGTLAQRRNRS